MSVKVRELKSGVHFSAWFRRMFTTTCDGLAVQCRTKKGWYPSMQMALTALDRGLPTERELLIARELHGTSALVLTSLEDKFQEFSAACAEASGSL